jgi:hypothetical protein
MGRTGCNYSISLVHLLFSIPLLQNAKTRTLIGKHTEQGGFSELPHYIIVQLSIIYINIASDMAIF